MLPPPSGPRLPSFAALLVSTLAACSSDPGAGSEGDGKEDDILHEAPDLVVEGGPYTLQPGEEKYLCYTANVPEATSFASFSIDDYPSVHHMFFARALAPEEEGVHECDTLFKPTWLPLFTTGKGGTKLELPEGSAFPIDAGTQLVMQLHLLNTTDEVVTDTVKVDTWTLAPEEREYEAALFPFGTTVFELPPLQKSSVVHDCVMEKSMEAFVAFPHMHTLGTDMRFAVGKDEASLTELFGEPYDFDNQELVPVSFQLEPGDHTRVTCNFDNPTDRVIQYGESTHQEMCFFSIFIKDGDALDGHCVDISALFGPPTAPAAP